MRIIIKTMSSKKNSVAIVCLFIVIGVFAAQANAAPELHIDAHGNISAKEVAVAQISGTTLFSRLSWGGNSFLRFTIVTDNATVVRKRYGEKSTVADIKEGHLLDVEGLLRFGSDSFQIAAEKIRNLSLEREQKDVSGTIQTINTASRSFYLTRKIRDPLTVQVTSDTVITKGVRNIGFDELVSGDAVLSARGVYDYPSNVLTAEKITVYQEKTIFKAKNFEGTLKRVEGTALPTTLIVTIGGKEYTVELNEKTKILSRTRKPATLARFVAGDTVRFYGAIAENNLTVIKNVEIVRNLNF